MTAVSSSPTGRASSPPAGPGSQSSGRNCRAPAAVTADRAQQIEGIGGAGIRPFSSLTQKVRIIRQEIVKECGYRRADIVENVTSGRKTAAQMARLYKISEPTVSRILGGARTADVEP